MRQRCFGCCIFAFTFIYWLKLSIALKPLIPDSFLNMLPTIFLRCCYNVTQKGINRDFFRSISCVLPTISTAMLSCKVSVHFFSYSWKVTWKKFIMRQRRHKLEFRYMSLARRLKIRLSSSLKR